VLTPDELEVFFLRYNGTPAGSWDLRHARRSADDAPWGAVVTDPMTPGAQGFLSLTAAGKKLYFWTTTQNYRAGRSSTADKFGTPAGYNSPDNPFSFVVASDDAVYFHRIVGVEGGTESFIHRATLDFNGHTLGTPVPNIHLADYDDSRPVLNESETVMYFGSNRPRGQSATITSSDVWVSRRASKQQEFGPGTYVRELSSDEEPDYVTWVSNDDCIVMLDRASHIYMAKRPL
jgi:hypothetical protein